MLSDELLLLLLQIFKLSTNPNLRIGYNSMGADCMANNLHFHLLYADRLFPSPLDGSPACFPIETAEKSLFYRTNLKHKNEDEVNMYNCGVRFGEVLNWPVRALVISPDISPSSDASLEDA